MSDMFNVEPPRWLQDITRVQEHGQWGQVLGTGLGALTRMLTEKNPVYDDQGKPVLDAQGQQVKERPSFGAALQETRSAQRDPMWKLKAQEAQTSVWNNVAQLEATHQKLKMQADESKGRTADLPKLNQYMQDLKSDLSAVPPVMESIWGQQQVETLSRAAQVKDVRDRQLKISEENSKAQAEYRSKVAEFDNVLARDGMLASQVAGLPGQGYTTDGYGRRIPTAEARIIVNKYLVDHGEQPLGTSVQEKVATIRTEGQLKLGEQRIEGGLTLEEQRQKDREALEATKQTGREKIEGIRTERALTVEEARQQHRVELEKMKDQLYSGTPKVIDVAGQKFVQWGKHPLKPLSNMTAAQKALLSIDEANIKNIQSALTKNPERPEEARSEESLTRQLLEAKLRFNKKWMKPIAAEPKDQPPSADVTAPALSPVAPQINPKDPANLY